MKQVPIHVLLNNAENREAYYHLSDIYDEAVPYIGTGVSFYCASWGKPFNAILQELKHSRFIDDTCFFNQLTKEQSQRAKKALEAFGEHELCSGFTCLRDYLRFAIDAINQTREKPDKIVVRFPHQGGVKETERIWKFFDRLYNDNQFLELGELINIVSMTLTGESFDKRFFNTIEDCSSIAAAKLDEDIKKIEQLNSIDNQNLLPPARWFLPFFGSKSKIAFTTNTDSSLQWIYERVIGSTPIQSCGYSRPEEINRMIKACGKNRVIYHIHGFQPEKYHDTSNTFIMTWCDYYKAYRRINGSPLPMLVDYFKDRFFVFIGASLEKDTTVDLMKKTASIELASDRHVALFRFPNKPEDLASFTSKTIYLKSEMATLTLALCDHDYASNVLCQLVREKSMAEWAIYNRILQFQNPSESLVTPLIDAFLETDVSFSIYENELCEADLENKLYPALKKYITENEKRSFKWSVCRIDHEEFDFPIKQGSKTFALDSYSAPLGNTIYIVGGAGLTDAKRAALIDTLRKWTRSHENNYWSEPVKVRVFRVSVTGDYSPERLIECLTLISNYSNEEALEELIKLITGLRNYQTYSCVLPSNAQMSSINTETVFYWVYILLASLASMELFSQCSLQIEAQKTCMKNHTSEDSQTDKMEESKVLVYKPDIQVGG